MSGTSTGSMAVTSISAPPDVGAAANAVLRTVKNFMEMEEGARTVAMALPAYMGRVNVVLLEEELCCTEVISEMAGTSSFAATRGKSDLAEDEWAETTCVNGEELD